MDGLIRLSTIDQSYSISVWIQPISVNSDTIIRESKCNYNDSSYWCLVFIGFTSSGKIANNPEMILILIIWSL